MLASGARAKMNQNPEYYNRIQELLAEYPTVFLKAIDLVYYSAVDSDLVNDIGPQTHVPGENVRSE